MTIFLNILFLIIGMALLIKGADFFVSGASSIAKKLKIPSMFIGLTVVALGTSMPELSISIASAIKGISDMSIGNIVGSNMMNMLLILGIVALIHPVPLGKSTKKIDFPFLIGITLLLLLFSSDTILNGDGSNIISRTEGIILLVVLIIYIVLLILNANRERKQTFEFEKPEEIEFSVDANSKNIHKAKDNKKEEKILKWWQIILCIAFGLGAVVFGAECVSTTAQFLALKIGMSDALVGLTIFAIGTSLPELATSIAAAKKGDNQMALGNILGSNVINISLILGLVSTISPIAVSTTILIDMLILAVFTIIFSIFAVTSKTNISRWKGAVLVGMYVAYMIFAIVRNYCF